ncbi:SID1 transmembrane family member 1-like isoform X1 [Pollicipes pollicipes]|uniref:SID1 transmembrane family member 1-like isoform X1 n=1 Tax=Pollicipes pollicipes TaxID=41117 RepID=UPI001884F84C|nr:SID1 transmembrane family member 1-like isoform X1 [Pollicipes pollicipes]XP_037072023.1 SID1 transmembrane family member 1-like isoform X1 [Pollicipes pollicipes]XP_037072024.1 SID1 transmembrane family member 1-like isoform X1 [Pollicipes pollicipes]XP_037072025.1 SID1 transmembrane family member 1-like isoform X1 [Pollicipes pollicipes]XP_037072027.1 SID1 transmembrane family member 1-like isoform X1 [Pollicipes pollicipes]
MMACCGSILGWAYSTLLLLNHVCDADLLSIFHLLDAPVPSPVRQAGGAMRPEVVMASLDHIYTSVVNVSTEFIFVYHVANLSEDSALRVSVSSGNATLDLPLLFAVRQQRGILSWPLPLAIQRADAKHLYMDVSKTICPVQNYVHAREAAQPSEDVFLEVSTASSLNVGFSLVLRRERIAIGLQAPRKLEMTPSSPQFIRFNFPADVSTALVKVSSSDDLCATVSIQNVSCPIFDSQQEVAYGNQYQTMTLKAGITVRRENFPLGMFIVLVVHGDDSQCSHAYEHIGALRQKRVEVVVQETISPADYVTATVGALGFCGLFYLLSILLSVGHYVRQRQQRLGLPEESPPMANYGAISTASSDTAAAARAAVSPSSSGASGSVQRPDSDQSGLDETEIDMLHEAEHDKDVFRPRGRYQRVHSDDSSLDGVDLDRMLDGLYRKACVRTKTLLFVSDLARKNPRALAKKSQLYIWNLITIAVFYAVPVVQLVITYQKVLNVTGDQDICYYNFLCAHPLGVLSDFNHVYSNVGYVLLGLLFIGLTKRRDLLHQANIRANDRFEQSYGIPRHFGLFYAMGAALMMEGILSGCYHVCPSYSNFQFDTAFMYVIAVLCMLKIYQTRHPDINASAYVTFLVLSFVVFVGVIGVLEGTVYFWFSFIALHLCICVVLSAQIYYMGRWSLNGGVFLRIYQNVRNDLATSPTLCFRPAYPDRMVLLVIANLFNLGLAVFGGVTVPKDFASYLLAIFITNLLLYTSFYIIMKLRHGERIQLQPIIYIVLCSLSWAAAIFFFLRKSTTWQLSPAQSRTKNRECEILNFYDDHDIWHFLSASSMFFGFMILLTLDDDLVFTRRDQIPVF